MTDGPSTEQPLENGTPATPAVVPSAALPAHLGRLIYRERRRGGTKTPLPGPGNRRIDVSESGLI